MTTLGKGCIWDSHDDSYKTLADLIELLFQAWERSSDTQTLTRPRLTAKGIGEGLVKFELVKEIE